MLSLFLSKDHRTENICFYTSDCALPQISVNICADDVDLWLEFHFFGLGLTECCGILFWRIPGTENREIYPISFRRVRQIIEAFQTAAHFRWIRDLRCDVREGDISSSTNVAREAVKEPGECQPERKAGEGRSEEVLLSFGSVGGVPPGKTGTNANKQPKVSFLDDGSRICLFL